MSNDEILNSFPAFKEVKIFAFGETTHHGKEFFDYKIAFFKSLVERQGVRNFIMEENYIGAHNINSYIHGGEGEVRKLVGNLGFGIWRTEEVLELVEWMRNYNKKNTGDQVNFYGIDCQFGNGINDIVRGFVSKNELSIDSNLLATIDTCANLRRDTKNLAQRKEYYSKTLATLQNTIAKLVKPGITDRDEVIHAIRILQQVVEFIASPSPMERDKNMAENVLWINRQAENKSFIWAHNLHVAKMANVVPMGYYLKKELGKSYCSVGFDFGRGKLYEIQADRSGATIYNLETPIESSFSSVFNQFASDSFLFDVNMALTDNSMKKFLSSKKNVLILGARGYSANDAAGIKQDISQAYDCIIFIKDISPPKYLEDQLPGWLLLKK